MPEFASKLAHPATPSVAGKPRASAHTRAHTTSPQDQVLYDNGPANGTTDAWTINFGYIVSDSFTGGNVTGFDFYAWEFPGDVLSSVDWSITDSPNGGTVYGSGTVSVTDTFISTNQFGYNIDHISASGLNVGVPSGTVWLNLQNAVVPSGDPVYWDENSGVGCQSSGCPSQAYEYSLGTIPSESFDIVGLGGVECVHNVPKDGFQIIHQFTAKEGGKHGPNSGVVIDKAGNLYGSIYDGGDLGQGLLYKLAQNSGSWILNPLYSFAGGANGGDPGQVTLGPEGDLYGSASGGTQTCGNDGKSYCGLVYEMRPSPVACLTALCSWMENVLYPFTGNTDAWGGEVSAFDQAGNLFGFSSSGGAYGKGAVFELTPSGGGWTEKVIYSFTGSDGDGVNALLVGSDGNLYGTTFVGGHGGGVVFQLVLSGGSWTEQDIASFGGCTFDTGCSPVLVQENSGNLYVLDAYDKYYSAYGNDWWDTYGTIILISLSDGKWQLTLIDDRGYYYGVLGLGGYGDDVFHDLTIDAAGRLYMAEGSQYCCSEYLQEIYAGAVMELIAPFNEHNLLASTGTILGI
jgi:hypothetical protein